MQPRSGINDEFASDWWSVMADAATACSNPHYTSAHVKRISLMDEPRSASAFSSHWDSLSPRWKCEGNGIWCRPERSLSSWIRGRRRTRYHYQRVASFVTVIVTTIIIQITIHYSVNCTYMVLYLLRIVFLVWEKRGDVEHDLDPSPVSVNRVEAGQIVNSVQSSFVLVESYKEKKKKVLFLKSFEKEENYFYNPIWYIYLWDGLYLRWWIKTHQRVDCAHCYPRSLLRCTVLLWRRWRPPWAPTW